MKVSVAEVAPNDALLLLNLKIKTEIEDYYQTRSSQQLIVFHEKLKEELPLVWIP